MMNKIFSLKFKIFNSSKGFTVLESIVAIFILSLAISGVFAAVQQSLSQSIMAKDEVRAFYLAQEAIEVLRHNRDTTQLNRISGLAVSWLNQVTANCPFNRICRVDATDLTIFDCGATWGSCENLKQDPSNYLYNYNTGAVTNFKREIQIESISPTEIAVTVRVLWTKGILTRTFKAKTHLFDWVGVSS